jgi:hypothetical protein
LRSERGGMPFRIVEVVDRNEGRLPAHRQPDVASANFRVDRIA